MASFLLSDFKFAHWAATTGAAKSLQSCLTPCDHVHHSPPGSPVPGILQARTLEWVAISFSNAWKWKVKVKSLSHVWLFTTPWGPLRGTHKALGPPPLTPAKAVSKICNVSLSPSPRPHCVALSVPSTLQDMSNTCLSKFPDGFCWNVSCHYYKNHKGWSSCALGSHWGNVSRAPASSAGLGIQAKSIVMDGLRPAQHLQKSMCWGPTSPCDGV